MANVGEHYQKDFDAESYNDIISSWGSEGFEEEAVAFHTFWANVFKDPQVRGSSMIDIGSGPTVYNLAPACHHFSNIVLSEYVHSNKEQLRKWLRNDPDALDCSDPIKKSAIAQGFKDTDKAVAEIQDKIRSRVKAVIHCDMLADQVVSEEYTGPYDLVMTSLCLESASPDYVTYCRCYKKLNRILKLGGFLAVKGFLMGCNYQVGDQEFPHLEVSQQQVQEALEGAGFGDVQWQVMDRKDKDYFYQFQSLYVLRATKLRECEL